MAYLLDAVSTFLFFFVGLGGLVVGLMSALTRAQLNHGVITTELAYRKWRTRAFILIGMGVLWVLTPIQTVVTEHQLNAGSAGIVAAGVVSIAGGIVWQEYLSQRLSRMR